MRQTFFIAIAILLSSFAFSAPVIKSVNTGSWDAAGTWDLNRTPLAGDTIVITKGTTVSVSGISNINGFSYVEVLGTLNFDGHAAILSLGTNSTVSIYNGGIVSGNQSSQKLKIDGTVVYTGGVPATGPQTLSVNTIALAPSTTLPVKFISFSLTRKTSEILVQWATAQEMNAATYAVEKSFDATNWSVIGNVTAAGTTTQVTNYTYSDKSPSAKTVYYRIKQVDLDGHYTYTPVKILTAEATGIADIKVSGIQDKVVLQFPQEVKGATQVRFVSMSGQVMEQQVLNGAVGQVILNSKIKGSFVVVINNGTLQVAKQVLL